MANEVTVTILHIFVGTVLHLVSYDIGFLTQYMPLTLSSCINYYYYYYYYYYYVLLCVIMP